MLSDKWLSKYGLLVQLGRGLDHVLDHLPRLRISHVPAPRVVSPALPRDHLSLYADDDDQFNSHSEDHQDLAPDAEIHSK